MMMIVLLEWFLSKFILDIIKRLMLLINGFQNGSTGTIYIPTNQELHICNEDILVEGMPNVSVKNADTKTVKFLNNIEIKRLTAKEDDPNDEYYKIFRDNSIQKYRIVSVDDNRKGNLQHYKLGVSE